MLRLFEQLPICLLALLAISLLAAHLSLASQQQADNNNNNKDEVRQLQRNLYKINQYLEARVGGEQGSDVDLILSEANKWLNELTSQENDDKSDLIASLELFLSLRDLSNFEQTCNSRGYHIMHANNLALADLARYAMRPVDKVALRYMREHPQGCCSRYPELYAQKLSSMDGEKLSRVATFADSIASYALESGQFELTFGAETLEEVLEHKPLVYILLLDGDRHTGSGHRQKRRIRDDEEIQVIADILRKSSGVVELPRDQEALGKLFQAHLLEPCKYYAEHVGADIYKPLEADLIVSLDSRGQVADCNAGSQAFKLALVRHKLCEIYILNESFNGGGAQLIKSISQLARQVR